MKKLWDTLDRIRDESEDAAHASLVRTTFPPSTSGDPIYQGPI